VRGASIDAVTRARPDRGLGVRGGDGELRGAHEGTKDEVRRRRHVFDAMGDHDAIEIELEGSFIAPPRCRLARGRARFRSRRARRGSGQSALHRPGGTQDGTGGAERLATHPARSIVEQRIVIGELGGGGRWMTGEHGD